MSKNNKIKKFKALEKDDFGNQFNNQKSFKKPKAKDKSSKNGFNRNAKSWDAEDDY
ncbi:MAG: hypothetical protein MUE85_09290 [Microscillaceae bacterium]|jgi:hypothetical protein|nr:hypothetical protein [Microscillaceae bacterium]